jgi:hypothetical protein
MLRLLFGSLESFFGPALAEIARWVHLGAMVVLALAVLRPVWRLWVEWRTARAGLAQRWVVDCQNCGQTSPVWAGHCSGCGTDLGVPWYVRWRTKGAAWLTSPGAVTAARLYQGAGALLFLGAAAWVVAATGALSPGGALHRLFLGLALLALAGAGRSLGRATRLERRGLLSRGGDALQGTAAVGVLAAALFLANAARPPVETRLATLAARPGSVEINGRPLRLGAEGEVGVEYLHVSHEALGYGRTVPLAYVAAERMPIDRPAVARWLVAHLRANADAYERRGVIVRLRRDLRRVTPGERYEVVEAGGQLLIRRAPHAPQT